MISRENNKNNLFRVKSKNGVLRCLKAGMDINMCNSKGQTALFTCNVPEAIQAMIDADIDIHHLDNDGNNALFYAQNVETVELLVSNGINVNHRNKCIVYISFKWNEKKGVAIAIFGMDI